MTRTTVKVDMLDNRRLGLSTERYRALMQTAAFVRIVRQQADALHQATGHPICLTLASQAEEILDQLAGGFDIVTRVVPVDSRNLETVERI